MTLQTCRFTDSYRRAIRALSLLHPATVCVLLSSVHLGHCPPSYSRALHCAIDLACRLLLGGSTYSGIVCTLYSTFPCSQTAIRLHFALCGSIAIRAIAHVCSHCYRSAIALGLAQSLSVTRESPFGTGRHFPPENQQSSRGSRIYAPVPLPGWAAPCLG